MNRALLLSGEPRRMPSFWVGRLAYERADWRWRDIDTLNVEQVWMNFYHGGTAVPPANLHVYIDNVVIATEYIGPMK